MGDAERVREATGRPGEPARTPGVFACLPLARELLGQRLMSLPVRPENTSTLRREVTRPVSRAQIFVCLLLLSILPLLTCTAFLLAGSLVPRTSSRVSIELAPEIASMPSSVPARVPAISIEPAPMPRAPALEPAVAFVFDVDGAVYMHLDDIDVPDPRGEGAAVQQRDRVPAHAPPALVRENGLLYATVAEVEAAALPAATRAWDGRAVLVDSTCQARVTGFALVTRVFSDYLVDEARGEPRASEPELIRAVLESGHMVLAARLDGCPGTYAQSADHPASPAARVLEDHPAGPAAERALRRSDIARQTQKAWREAEYPGHWWREAEVSARVLQHPHSGELLVSVHAVADVMCGGLEIDLWGLYRVAAHGTLEPLVERALDNVGALETFVDIDGDGRFEMLASSMWGLDRYLLDPDGNRQSMLRLPFYGCQC